MLETKNLLRIITSSSLTIAACSLYALHLSEKKHLALVQQLESRFTSIFPIIPKLDRNIDFTIDFYGVTLAGNTKEDYELYFGGGQEKPELMFLREYALGLPDAASSGVFLDVGAFKGQHSLFMSQFLSKVYAFEPFPKVIELFEKNLSLNSDITNIQLVPLALGDEDNVERLYYEPNDKWFSTGSFDEGFSKDKNKAFGELKIVRGDSFFSQSKQRQNDASRIEIIKLDVEGYEKKVLLGLQNTIIQSRPLVLMELLEGSGATNSFVNVADVLKFFPHDYSAFHFGAYDALMGTYELVPLHSFSDRVDSGNRRNIVLAPNEKIPAVPLKKL